MGLAKLARKREEQSLTDRLREVGDVTGTATGAIYNIAKSKVNKPKDIVRKGAIGAFLGFQAGDGLGDFAGWMAEKKEKEKK